MADRESSLVLSATSRSVSHHHAATADPTAQTPTIHQFVIGGIGHRSAILDNFKLGEDQTMAADSFSPSGEEPSFSLDMSEETPAVVADGWDARGIDPSVAALKRALVCEKVLAEWRCSKYIDSSLV